MAYQHTEPVSKQLTIVVGLTVVGFMAFGLALSYYRNLLFEQTLKEIKEQNHALVEQNLANRRENEYYHSSQYKDKYAKENLGKVRPGETVLIITKPPAPVAIQQDDVLTPTEEQEAEYAELLRQTPTLEHWELFLFYPERVEEIKKSL